MSLVKMFERGQQSNPRIGKFYILAEEEIYSSLFRLAGKISKQGAQFVSEALSSRTSEDREKSSSGSYQPLTRRTAITRMFSTFATLFKMRFSKKNNFLICILAILRHFPQLEFFFSFSFKKYPNFRRKNLFEGNFTNL